jgi:hypothetical protein
MTPSRHGSRLVVAVPLLAVTLVVGWLVQAAAQDDLYGGAAPVDAAWVRAVNAEASGGLGIRIADGPLEVIALADATAYRLVAPGSVSVDLGGEPLTVEVEAGAFVTVVAAPAGPLVIEDEPLIDVSRGLLALYNLTTFAALELVVVDGPSVVADVAPGSQAAVMVSEAEVALEVRSGEQVVGTLETRLFERGVAHSVLVVEGPDGPIVRYVRAVAAE